MTRTTRSSWADRRSGRPPTAMTRALLDIGSTQVKPQKSRLPMTVCNHARGRQEETPIAGSVSTGYAYDNKHVNESNDDGKEWSSVVIMLWLNTSVVVTVTHPLKTPQHPDMPEAERKRLKSREYHMQCLRLGDL